MDILLLGGTGAMGVPLVDLLSKEKSNILYVTSRSKKTSRENVNYIQGNAKDPDFLSSLLQRKYDAIFDFLIYGTDEFSGRLSTLLQHTDQYFFFSSARCFADSPSLITEDSPRLIDVCRDQVYLAKDEYGLAKGREENLLRSSGYNNWTIIRPYITYNFNRMQLGVFEKEHWLRRGLDGRTIVFPSDIADRKTTLTYAPDVAKALTLLIGNQKAYGEAFNITTGETHTWREILEFYVREVERITGKKLKVQFSDNSVALQSVWNQWQIKYDRLYDRAFDNSRLTSVIGPFEFKPTFSGLSNCLTEFLSSPQWLEMNWRYEAWCDRQCGEFTSISQFKTAKRKIGYLMRRFLDL